MRNRFLLFGLLFALFGQLSYGQTGDGFLKGKVTDKTTKEALPLANLMLFRNGVRTMAKQTDFDGTYVLGPLEPGIYDLRVTYVGYPDQRVNGIVIKADKNTFANVEMFVPDTGLGRMGPVIITHYNTPVLDKDQVTQGNTITGEEIKKIPGRDIRTIISATTGGVTESEGNLNFRGSRNTNNVVIVDGVRIGGSVPNLPKNAIEQLAVITGGVPAEYGDMTGGVISITTRGPSKKYFGGLEAVTSQFIDPFGYNVLEGNLSGPLWIRGDKNNDSSRAILGFFVAGNLTRLGVADPPAIDMYRVKDDKINELKNNPLRPSPLGSGFVPNAEFVTKDDMIRSRVRPNTSRTDYSFTTKIDFQPSKMVNVTIGGTADHSNYNAFIYQYSMFNYENNPQVLASNYRGFVRLRQFFNTGENSIVKNAYYTLQADYTKGITTVQDENLKDDYWSYGYLGKFDRNYVPLYAHEKRIVEGKELTTNYFTGYAENGVKFTPGGVNPVTENYTKTYFDLAGNDVFSYAQVQTSGGLLNGYPPQIVYSLWNNVGTIYNQYSHTETGKFTINANGAAQVKNHSLKFGLQYEQRTQRGFTVSPQGLWILGRQLENSHLTQLDLDHPMPVRDENGFRDTVNYNYLIKPGTQATFDKSLRDLAKSRGDLDVTGKPVTDQSYINIDRYSPSDLSSFAGHGLGMFSADELLNNGNSYINYYGYDYLGNKKGHSSIDDFLNPEKRGISPYNPIYTAGYVEDKFEFHDLTFRVGLRVDRFDANQPVLKDPYSLYPVRTAGEVSQINNKPVSHPGNIGSDYVVYIDNQENPTKIVGYRNGATWYDASGAEIADPNLIAQKSKGGIQPYLAESVDPKKPTLTKESFTDYKPQINVMPRVSFSFPISDKSAFFANYDVLTSRPTAGNLSSIDDYYYLKSRSTGIIANPNLKPEKRTNYEIGFKQVIGEKKNSAISITAFYGELRDQIQRIQLNQAYPITYTTFGNLDFGTVKGTTAGYSLKRSGSNGVQLDANYTLQFAEGTGSDAGSAQSLINAGQPNLRTPFPLDYDVRHTLSAIFDYRFGQGKEYSGPVGKNGRHILENTGFNILMITKSGTPYTRQTNPTPTVEIGVAGRSSITGDINSSRMPWQFRADARLDRDFFFTGKKKRDEGAAPSMVYMNVYLQVQNIFDTKNVISVYRYTGLPNDDGYLSSDLGQREMRTVSDPKAFADQYSIKVNNPDNYTQPRFLRIGASINF